MSIKGLCFCCTLLFDYMKLITVVLLTILLFSCKQSEITTSPDIKQRVNRHIGYHVTMPQSLEYNECFLLAKNTGMSIIPMTFGWNAIEPDKNLYDSTLPVISQLYYPAQNVSLCLTITPIYAIGRGVPKDLMNTAWNSPVMITRFGEFLTRLRTTMPSVSISYIILGNEKT